MQISLKTICLQIFSYEMPLLIHTIHFPLPNQFSSWYNEMQNKPVDPHRQLKKEDIPIGPHPDTLGITYRAGQLELLKGCRDNARDCFAMVYDLTLEEEIKELLAQL